MSILTGSEISRRFNRGELDITPWNPDNVQPNSYDLTLSDQILEVGANTGCPCHNWECSYEKAHIDPRLPQRTVELKAQEGGGFLLDPGRLYLGSTVERTRVGNHVPMIQGRSSIARMGLSVHITAGLGETGWDGTWTLEMMAALPIMVFPGMRICQLFLSEAVGDITPYTGKYQGQTTPTPSRFAQEMKTNDV